MSDGVVTQNGSVQPSIGRFEANALPRSGHLSINAGGLSDRRHCAPADWPPADSTTNRTPSLSSPGHISPDLRNCGIDGDICRRATRRHRSSLNAPRNSRDRYDHSDFEERAVFCVGCNIMPLCANVDGGREKIFLANQTRIELTFPRMFEPLFVVNV